jgi:uncharacterized protein (TIGR03437 family)
MKENCRHQIVVAKIGVITAAVPVLLWAFSGGPDPRHTGAPGDQTCAKAGCHTGAAVNSGGGGVAITFPSGTTYVPGQKQRWTIAVTHPNARAYGFQATARLASNESNGQAGAFNGVDGTTQVLCDDGSPKGAAGCRANFNVEFIEQTESSVSGTWTVEWTPPATDAGNIRIYIAGNGANGNRTSSGDFIYTANYTLTPASGGGGGGGGGANRPAITQGGVVDAWVASAGVAPSTWTAIYGTNLAANTKTWDDAVRGNTLPTTVDGVSVSIDNKPATIFFVSPGQINVLTPHDLGVGDLPVVVRNANGESMPFTVRGAQFKPTFYVFPQATQNNRVYLTAVALDGTYLGKAGGADTRVRRAARPGETILLFGSGFGATNPVVPSNQIVSGAPAVTTPVTIRFGQTAANIANGNGNLVAAGLYQFNVTVPATLADGEYPVVAEVGGIFSSSTVYLPVQR